MLAGSAGRAASVVPVVRANGARGWPDGPQAPYRRDVRTGLPVEDNPLPVQKFDLIGQFAGGFAHEFNNLLTVVLGNLEMMQRRLAPEHDMQRTISGALGAAARAAQLVERLVSFARGRPNVPEIVAPNSLIAGLAGLLRHALGESTGMETILTAGVWNVLVDRHQLERALIALAINARGAMPEGGTLSIATGNCYLDTAYCAREGDALPGEHVGIFVIAARPGMTEELTARAFGPVFAPADGQGAGLGLSQVQDFVRQSGGQIKIRSMAGEGISVRLYLPRHRGAVPGATMVPGEIVLPRAKPGEAMLIVEDDPDVRFYAADLATELGYGVVSAANGTEALRLLDSHPELRLLVTDLCLPGMNGLELADEAVRRRPGLRVLFTTGYRRDAFADHGRIGPGIDIVRKPLSSSDLALKIRRALER